MQTAHPRGRDALAVENAAFAAADRHAIHISHYALDSCRNIKSLQKDSAGSIIILQSRQKKKKGGVEINLLFKYLENE